MKFLTKIFSCIALMVFGGEAWAAPQHISIGERDFEAITAFTVDTSVDSLELPNGAFALWNQNPVYETSDMDYDKVSHDIIAFLKPIGYNRGVALTNSIMIKSRNGAGSCLADKFGDLYTEVTDSMGNIKVANFEEWKSYMSSLKQDECVLKVAPVYNTNVRASVQ